MSECGRRKTPGPSIETEVAVHEVNCAGDECSQQEDPQEPILERDVEGQREEVEADVLVEQRIVPAKRRLVDEPEDEVPPAALAHSDEQCEDDRDDQDEQTPN